MTTKPTIVFVHGAWHTSEGFTRVKQELTTAGYPVELLDLPSCTTNGPYIQFIDGDVQYIRSVLQKLADEGKEIAVVMHSYGGMPGSQAAEGFAKKEREQRGEKGGIVQMIYMSAFAPQEGQCLAEINAERSLPWIKMDGINTFTTADESRTVFYNDLSEKDAAYWTSRLVKFASQCYVGKVNYAAWKHIPSTFIVCTKDEAIPLSEQEKFINQEGAKFHIETLEASHSPFLSTPKELAEAIGNALRLNA